MKMKKLLLCMAMGICVFCGCQKKEMEEAVAVAQEIICEDAGIVFQLNGLWEIDYDENQQDTKTVELWAKQQETGANLLIFHEELEKIKTGDLLRLEDYIESLKENLKIAEDYNYSLQETSQTILYGKSYYTFLATSPKMGARQQYYIRKNEDKITTIVVTVYEDDSIREILALGKKI